MFWGFSEALDLHEEYTKHITSNNVDTKSELNILLFGASDGRHILKTLSKSYKHPIKINFYIVEGCLEVIARQLLLIKLALEQPHQLSLKSKTHIFMDLYGNTLLRPISGNYMASKSNEFLKIITDLDEYAVKAMPSFNFSLLKFSERDGLENIFKFWQNKPNHVFNIERYWEERLRQELGERFDHRHGAFDWDLQMKLKEYGGQQICTQEYKHWRDVGVAFVFPEYEQTIPNKTLAVCLVRNGATYKHRGYLGDITSGPFTAYGLHCTDADMLKSSHGTNQFRATDITERNVFEILFELQHKKPYQHNVKESRSFGETILQLSKHMPHHIVNSENLDLKPYNCPQMAIENATITVLPIEDVLNVQKRFTNYFDVVFVAQNYFPFLKNDFLDVLKENEAFILFETKQMTVMRKEEISKFLCKVKQFANSNHLNSITKFNINLPLPIVKYRNF